MAASKLWGGAYNAALSEGVPGYPNRVEVQLFRQFRPFENVLVDLDVGPAHWVGVDLVLVGILFVDLGRWPRKKRPNFMLAPLLYSGVDLHQLIPGI